MDALGLDYEVAVLTDATASKSEQVQGNNLEGDQGTCSSLVVLPDGGASSKLQNLKCDPPGSTRQSLLGGSSDPSA